MNADSRTPITLVAALLLGAALGLAGPWAKQPAAETVTTRSKGSNAGSIPSRAGADSSSTVRTAEVSPSVAYAAAWDQLQHRDLRRSERQDLESRLLGEWSKIDLRAALHAAFEEDPAINDDPFDSPFGPCLGEAPQQLDLVWELVASREYGLHTRRLRRQWIETTAKKDPLEILRRLPEMPPDVRALAVCKAVADSHRFAGLYRTAAGKEEVIAAVLELRGSPYEAAAMSGLAGGIASINETSELSGLLLNPPDPALRDVYLKAYAMKVEHGSDGGRQVALDILPAETRAEVEALSGSPSIRLDGN